MDGRPRLGPENEAPRTPPFGSWPLDEEYANRVLASGDYGLRVVRRDDRALLVGEGTGTGVPLDTPTWSALYRTLIRLRKTRRRPDARWLAKLTRAVDPIAPGAARPTNEWNRFARSASEDPILRMHCASLDISGAGDVETADRPPRPPHPDHPGGTIAVTLPALTSEREGLPIGLLGDIVDNRFERSESELSFFLEHFVRPPLRAFRLALESARPTLLTLHRSALAFELSPELRPTGRIVVTPSVGTTDSSCASARDVREGVGALLDTLEALAGSFSGVGDNTSRVGIGPNGGYEDVHDAMHRIIGEELRDLEAGSAAVLSGEHPLRRFVHTVPAEQDRVLKRVLSTVQERARMRRRGRHLPQPTVVIDLDLCAFVNGGEQVPSANGRPAAPGAASPSTKYVTGIATGRGEPVSSPNRPRTADPVERSEQANHHAIGSVNPGLGRFVWDVRDAGGRVVFCTGGHERVAERLRSVLRESGLPDADLLLLTETGQSDVAHSSTRKPPELGNIEAVAVFDGMLAERIAITGRFAGAMAVSVALPGTDVVSEIETGSVEVTADEGARRGAQARVGPESTSNSGADRLPSGSGRTQPLSSDEHSPVITTFETSPRHHGNRRGPALSHTHSLEELQLALLRENRHARRWSAHIDESQSVSIIESVVREADRAAERTARSAFTRSQVGSPGREHLSGVDEIVWALHHVFTRKQFLKGSRSNYLLADMHRDASGFIERGEPVEVMLLGFPIKQSLNRLKAFGPLPDIAELGGLVRLRELQQAVRRIYPPGLRINILTDGRHFRPRPESLTAAYTRKLREYIGLVGIGDCVSIREIDGLARERLGPGLPQERAVLFERFRTALEQALHGLDITRNPLRTLDRVQARASGLDGPLASVTARSLELFRELVMSMAYSVPVPIPRGVDRMTWSRMVYADVYNLTDTETAPEVRRARTAVLRRAWHNAVRYLTTMRVDEELGYEKLLPRRVRLTVSAVTPGRCGFTYLGGSGLLPWQGTGVLDGRGYVSVDFAVSLLDQGFVPVYSNLLGDAQPWMMVPPEYTFAPPRGTRSSGMRLDRTFAQRARLRRK